MAGLKTSCDPLDFTITLDGFAEQRVFKNLSRAEHYVGIVNGDPGLRHISLMVNGMPFTNMAVRPNGRYMFDIQSAMTAPGQDGRSGSKNTLSVFASGARGASAEVIVGDSSIAAGISNHSVAVPEIPAPGGH